MMTLVSPSPQLYDDCAYCMFTAVIQNNLHWPAPPVKRRRILLVQSFTAHMSLLMAANQRIRIREKTLEFSSTVLCTLSPYLRPLCALAVFQVIRKR